VRHQRQPAGDGGGGKFRADLLDRLAFDVVQLPPLRERRSDIMLLADQFAIQMCRELGLPLFPGFSDYARRRCCLPLAGKYPRTEKRRGASVYRHGSSETELDNIIIDPFSAARRRPHQRLRRRPCSSPDLRQFQHDQEKQLLEQSLKRRNITRNGRLNCWV
jgi:psp operon transcriptional activator